jgi:hypothetical protein
MESFPIELFAAILGAAIWHAILDFSRKSDFVFRIRATFSEPSTRRKIKNLERRLEAFQDANSFIGELLLRLGGALLFSISGIVLLVGTMIIGEMRCEVKVECSTLDYDIANLMALALIVLAIREIYVLRDISRNTNRYREQLRTRIAELRNRLRE